MTHSLNWALKIFNFISFSQKEIESSGYQDQGSYPKAWVLNFTFPDPAEEAHETNRKHLEQ